MSDINSNIFDGLIAEGEKLIIQGYLPDSEEYSLWVTKCRSTIMGVFTGGKQSSEFYAFKKAGNHANRIQVLRALVEKTPKNKNGSIDKLHNEITLQMSQTQVNNTIITINIEQIFKNIDNSDLTKEQKQDIKDIASKVEFECKKQKPDWKKVINHLKDALSYGLKIAPDIIRLAEMYYKAQM